MAEAPRSAAAAYALENASGAGRDVDTVRPSRSAAATAPGVIVPHPDERLGPARTIDDDLQRNDDHTGLFRHGGGQ